MVLVMDGRQVVTEISSIRIKCCHLICNIMSLALHVKGLECSRVGMRGQSQVSAAYNRTYCTRAWFWYSEWDPMVLPVVVKWHYRQRPANTSVDIGMAIVVGGETLPIGRRSCPHYLHRVSKKHSKLFLSELRQISTNFDNFWHKDGQDNRIV